MSKFARRAAVAGAGLALAAVLSPVAHADGHAAATSASSLSLTPMTALETAPIYTKPTDSSRRVGYVRAGEEVQVFCTVKGPSGNLWYSIQDLGGNLFVWSGHFMSLAHPPKPC
ncbi:SH3 domain-containing protein [Streptomyces sp. NPDC048506]|uniref:SH3 domain-containing protein n=1 Tax=Streptomyces sp. NPDC048506 TaxID=3155028 RepID=UPI00342C79EC